MHCPDIRYNMDQDSQNLRAFTRVARLASFAAAARELRISTTTVSRRVAVFEEQLGARLLNRTTRRVTLTPAGVLALDQAEPILDALVELRASIAGDGTPRGHLRLTAGVSLGRSLLYDNLPSFLQDYPEVSVEVLLTDVHIDLVKERIDLALRIGDLPDSDLVARRLGTVELILCGAPDWVEMVGPLLPEQWAEQARIVDTNQGPIWHISHTDGRQLKIQATGRFAVNNAHAARDACQAGLGLALLPDFVAIPALQSGKLVRVLPEWSGPKPGFYGVVLQRRWVSPAVRALLEQIEKWAISTVNSP